MRVYSPEETVRLTPECRGFLLFLEQINILDDQTREMVIDRALALDETITVARLKWVALVVLFNKPGMEAALEWLEDWVLNIEGNALH
jgi:Smg protein